MVNDICLSFWFRKYKKNFCFILKVVSSKIRLCKNDTQSLIDFIKSETDNLKNLKENVLADIEWIKNKTSILDKEINNTNRKCICHKSSKTTSTTAKISIVKKMQTVKMKKRKKRSLDNYPNL